MEVALQECPNQINYIYRIDGVLIGLKHPPLLFRKGDIEFLSIIAPLGEIGRLLK